MTEVDPRRAAPAARTAPQLGKMKHDSLPDLLMETRSRTRTCDVSWEPTT